TSSFNSMTDYIVGDERFTKIRSSKRFIINTWCKKEYGNLKIARAASVSVPKPYMSNGSILAMEFIGDSNGKPAPMLKDAEIADPAGIFETILEDIRKLYASRLVHADLSEYNILINDGKPYLIDFGQAVTVRHPKALEFLDRDIANIAGYFRKRYGIETTFDEVKKKIIG
ncbi:MAG: RIO1 family regulatory kinase/ATPase, partial [Candidatus Micrarchaeaceae archaeon]